jgi:hypothetical protein
MSDFEVPKDMKVKVDDLMPFTACGCCITSCYLDFPDLIGCQRRSECLCCKGEMLGCKLGKTPEQWCLLQTGTAILGPPKVLCKEQAQIFCIDTRVSIPPVEDEVPCLVTLCCFTV